MEEAEENKLVVKETDPDKVLKSTFKIGFSNQSSKLSKDQMVLPHFEIIRREEERLARPERVQDEEQDEEDDVDV